ncbi:MAG: phytanoyl-CoA dioxygenase family protein [Cytophagales bacterium]|nr:phytanoyl-CoA dioxygenase family protein [Armatimonadota bacterium]
MPILSDDDHAFFAENGYLVVPGAVPADNLRAMVEAIWEFTGLNPDDPQDWYRAPLPFGGMIEMYQHQAMWNNRQHPRVYQAFAELLGTEKLWVSLDRVNLKPPRHPDHPEYDHKGFTHWDWDSSQPPSERRVQGVLYLTDTEADMGGFQCVPWLYKHFDEWVKTQPVDRNVRGPNLSGLTVEPIVGKAGDLIIWDVMLAHGNGHNVSTKPRLAQYISMFPARPAASEQREERIRQWREHTPPKNKIFPGDPREIEETLGRTAELTPLGKKLLGLDDWE